ncbi:MAG: leucyl/phenylalanyl-tRNA--protein transferase [Chloroflexaceae bacterium]|nr:leucyl/phenylalanyl-tRNA--protein transferase [Chloroflexaceae bacterium]
MRRPLPASLDPDTLIAAYCQGVFPMANQYGRIYWYDPDPRAIIPIETFQANRRLRRTLHHANFTIRINTAFRAVMLACAAPDEGRETTWISPRMITAYTNLHQLGYAHSVEAWRDGELVGGLYGVAIRGLFAGESMFSHTSNASKAALVALLERLQQRGFTLLDTQFTTPHLIRFGAIEIPREEYRARLDFALSIPTSFAP